MFNEMFNENERKSFELADALGISEEEDNELISLAVWHEREKGIQYLMEKTHCDKNVAIQIFDGYESAFGNTPEESACWAAERQEQINKPKCPICSSTNLSKISGMTKAAKIGLFGIFGAGDIGKTWKCNNCGSKF